MGCQRSFVSLTLGLFGLGFFILALPFAFAQTLGGYAYNSAPVDYKASNFACNPGEIQTSGNYSGRYNTYWYSYAEAYSNSGVPGSWCQHYSTDKVMAKSGSYLGADGIDHFQIRYNDHKNAAMKHDKIAVFYENTLPGYGTYYKTGETYAGGLDPSGSGFYSNQVVHCPSGAQVVDHIKYGATQSSGHLMNNASSGLYDGGGHKWCELNGVAVHPVGGPDTGKEMPDTATDKLILYKFTLPDANGNPLNFYKGVSVSGSFPTGLDSQKPLKCEFGIAGPFLEGVNQQYVSPYESDSNKAKVTAPHYHCLGQGPGTFVEPVLDTQTVPAGYESIWWSVGYSQSTCAAGDAACFGAGTKGKASNYCSKGTYWCHTKNPSFRTCAATPVCAAADFEAPPPEWTLAAPSNLKLTAKPLNGTAFQYGEQIQFTGIFSYSGTNIPLPGTVDVVLEISSSNTFSTIAGTKTYPHFFNTNNSQIGAQFVDQQQKLAAGTYFFRMKTKFSGQESPWGVAPTEQSFAVLPLPSDVPDTFPATVSLSPLTTLGANKYSITITDQDGIKSFSVFKTGGISVYSGTPGAAGNVGACGGTATMKMLTSGTITLESTDFRLKAAVLDCRPSALNVESFIQYPGGVYGSPTSCTALTLTLKDNKTLYTKGEDLTYTYKCNAGKAGNVSVIVVKPDGTKTLYVTGANIDTATMGFSTSNLAEGSYTLKACFEEACTSVGNASVAFSVKLSTILPPPQVDTPIACENGKKCPKGSWCSNGQKFFYPTSEIICLAWSNDGNQPPPPTGTVECDPADLNCVNTGQIIDYVANANKWCARGMRYFSKDGLKMTCALWNTEPPAGYTACSPTEANCKAKGDTWKGDDSKKDQYWCSSAKKCTLADGGGSCVGNMDQCPAGSKYCQTTEQNCVEPGERKKIVMNGTSSSYWCGGGGMIFYSTAEAYCEGMKSVGTSPASMMFTGADVKSILAKLGSGWALCNPNQSSSYGKCLEPGQIGRSEDWCAWWPPMTPGTATTMTPPPSGSPRACPNFDGITPELPKPEKPPLPALPEPPPCPVSYATPACPAGKILKFSDDKCRTPYCADEGGGGEPVKPPSACNVGETCESRSWCNMAKQCYFPDGKITCARWESLCPSGTKYCSPPDSKCIEPGETGPTDGWCRESMECFVNGKKFCQPIDYTDGGALETCPAGSQLCPPGDTNCIEPGKTGPFNGWCKNSLECYKPDAKEKLCQAWTPMSSTGVATVVAPMAPMMNESCPSGYKRCRPDDKSCVEIGETSKPGNKNGWCSGGRQCYKPDDTFFCARWNEECPKDTKLCRPEDQGCVEPGASTTRMDGWCGGTAVRCNNKDSKKPGFSCVGVAMMGDPMAWESVACPAGTSRCPSGDTNCMELGEKRREGARFAWCTNGMKRENTDGSVECVSSRDWQKPVEEVKPVTKKEDDFCIQVSITAYDPSTNTCKLFSTTCNIPTGWKQIAREQVCQDGRLLVYQDLITDTDYNGFGKLLAEERLHLDDLYVRVKVLPASVVEAKTLRSKIEDAVKFLKKLGQDTAKKSRKLAELQADLTAYRSGTLSDIDTSFIGLKPKMEFGFLAKDLDRQIKTYEQELKSQDKNSDYAQALKDGVEKLKGLLKSAESQTGIALEQIITVIKEVSIGLESLVSDNRSGVTSDYLSGMIESLTESVEKLQVFIDEKKVKDNKIEFMMGKLYAILQDLDLGEDGLGAGDLSRKLDEGTTIVQRVSKWLADYGLTKQEKVEARVEEAFAHLEEKIQRRVDEMLDTFANKVEVIVNAALMKVAENAAIVSERLEKVVLQVKDQLAQSLSNLTAVPENHRDAITETKNAILSNVEDVEVRLETAKLAPELAERLRTTMAMAATYNWCADVGEQVKAWMTRTNLALEAKTLNEEQVANFETDMGKLTGKNNEECYRIGAAAFRDVPTHEWYYAATEYNKSNDYIKGYADSRGNSTGKFGPGDPTLRIEALAMATRIYGIPQGDTDSLSQIVPGVPPWGVGYVNGAVKAGFTFDADKRLDEPITRAEVAEMFATLGGDKVDLSTPIDSAASYKDYEVFKADPDAVKAIDALSDLEILKGSGGYFRPDDPLVRSEFATINQRVVTNLGLEKEKEK